ncbi:DUF2892 domain-containing protein [Patescibacteria group bacterium]|nr:DUF2892 domain-containing protein [Patescibacteria group bacterium]MBU1721929.1 DUF2892 domain-containing protein [Patescibacteria group bacterium]MBU1901544.1 DUF2892 domain-containing protein [Patescibacteria group bacterium]
MKKYCINWKKAPNLRIAFFMAGTFSLISLALGIMLHPYYFILMGVVGFMQILFAITGFCPMVIGLQVVGKRECHLK